MDDEVLVLEEEMEDVAKGGDEDEDEEDAPDVLLELS